MPGRACDPVPILAACKLVGSNASRNSPAVWCGKVEAESVRQGEVAALHAVRDIHQYLDAAAPGGEPRAVSIRNTDALASSGLMLSAPPASFLRQSGLRMIVLAVKERRSPAESMNGNSVVASDAVAVASVSVAHSCGNWGLK